MGIKIHKITNANIFIDGEGQLGRASEINLPEIQMVMQEHSGLGMMGKMELPIGLDKAEGEIKWSAFYDDTMGRISNPFSAVPLQVRSSVGVYDARGRMNDKPMVTYITALFKSIPGGNYKHLADAEFTSKFSCVYFKQMVDSQVVVELDWLANIFAVNGRDVLGQIRDNLGQ